MMMTVLIAIAAGCASALMFVSMTSGVLVSLLLIYFCPLPLMVVGLGWGPLASTIGGITGAAGLGAAFGLPVGIVFAIMMALPAWWLGHLALLGRPMASAAPSGDGTAPVSPTIEWYPIGRLLLWIAGSATLTAMAVLLTLGTDAATITETMRATALRFIGQRAADSGDEVRQRIDGLVMIAPALIVVSTMTMLTLNLWLAARITVTSGRLHRPWPVLKRTELPPMTLAALSAAIAFCFTGGLLAILAQMITAALLMTYALTGLAVLHTLTLGLKSRTLWLSCTYAILLVSGGWLFVALVVLGITDAIFGFRQRYLRGRPPPLPAS
jgi:hypothetical protein